MKILAVIGILLIVVGVAAFVLHGISYTTREKVVDIGPIHMSADKTKTIPVGPIVGGAALVSGIVLLVLGLKKS